MVAIFTSLLFVGAFFAAASTITLMLELYGGRAMAALHMEHRPLGTSNATPYHPMHSMRISRTSPNDRRPITTVTRRAA